MGVVETAILYGLVGVAVALTILITAPFKGTPEKRTAPVELLPVKDPALEMEV